MNLIKSGLINNYEHSLIQGYREGTGTNAHLWNEFNPKTCDTLSRFSCDLCLEVT